MVTWPEYTGNRRRGKINSGRLWKARRDKKDQSREMTLK